MNNIKLTVKELSDQLDMTIANINIQIGRGHAGEVTKSGTGETSDYVLTLDNILTLLRWFQLNGRITKKGGRLKLMQTIRKYKELKEQE